MISNKLATIVVGGLGALVLSAGALAQTGAADWITGDQGHVMGPTPTNLVPDTAVGQAQQSPTAGETPFSDAQALDRLSTAAASMIRTTVGTVDRANGTQPVKVNGEIIELDDLALKEFTRLENTQEVVSAAGTHHSFFKERTVWMATWERENVFIEEWGIPCTVSVELIIEDGTGKIVSSDVTVFNPNAKAE